MRDLTAVPVVGARSRIEKLGHQIRIEPSIDPEMIWVPSGVNVTEVIAIPWTDSVMYEVL